MACPWVNRGAARRLGLSLGGTVGVALAGWGAVTAAQYGLDRWRPPPAPISAQLTDVVRDAARSGLRVAESAEADLRGSGETSRIIVLRSTARSERNVPDELRIYDVANGRLRLRFRFVPTARPQIEIRLAEIADIDGNGSKELIASLDEIYVEHDTTAPALVAWDPRTDAYGISPLLTPDSPKLGGSTRPRVVRHGKPAFLLTPVELYLEPVRIRDAATGRSFRSYAVQSFTVRRSTFSSYLLAGFIAGAHGRDVVSDLNAWSLGELTLPPLLYPCMSFEQLASLPFTTRHGESDAAALVRTWNRNRDELSC